MELLEILQQEWAMRALVSSAIVGVMCGVLGCFIVLRNISLLGDALSHAILPGAVFGYILGGSLLGFFSGAVLAGLFSAVAMTWIQLNVETKNDAAVGIVFTAMFSIGVMAISKISRTDGVHLDLQDFLFGKILGVSDQDIYLTGFIALYVLVSIVVFYRYLFITTFQPVVAETMGISVQMIHYFLMMLLSLAVVASLKMVGVILVVAMLITPAATALLLSNRLQVVLVIAAFVGLISTSLGLIVAIKVGTTPGPAMTITATIIYLLAALFAPKKGLVFKYLHKRQNQEKILLEDILKQTLKFEENGGGTVQKLVNRLGFSERKVHQKVQTLQNQNLLKLDKEVLQLTPEGKIQAMRLIRAHRLWETYLVNEMGLSTEQIHDDAENYEHILTDDIMDEMDAEMGFPKVDPHGSPIPPKSALPTFPLTQLALYQTAVIASEQLSSTIQSKLWKLGVLPNMTIERIDEVKDIVTIKANEQQIILPKALAEQVNIKG